ncbi:Txe/YoeB family addiction module toxin [Lentilactobacillus sp. IMAU92037]|uniref:Txe/YoeB family addiction module toxin n=1 Tax=Lentilactobacillus TaxID=2767893 RepID=UPI001C2796F7|nr:MULTISPECIES: Txe/YoeB family addiction module toxin [Lentilactobacillus]MBU9788563.1 Txe/YoeB family addiction module toxin [Lentilactobacillus dabitei]MBV0930003.1 Txe/YoeB family addiction module toxin [Lentilactobacillus dabitei]MDM7515375.1 Txe/YoeB family addiction module toxin [Lentilactobacillus sp. TOM.63]
MTYQIRVKKGAKKGMKKIKGSPLESNFLQIIKTLRENPYEPIQSFEKLVPPAAGYYSRRINSQHRVVYRVDEENKTVIIYAVYTHYE